MVSSDGALIVILYPFCAVVSSGAVTLRVVVVFAPAAMVNDDSPKVPHVELEPAKDNAISSSPLLWFSIFQLSVSSHSVSADCMSCQTIFSFGSKFCNTVERDVKFL